MFSLKHQIFITFVMCLLARATALAQTTVVTFSGSGGLNSRPFTVEPGWEIQWDAKGDIFQLYLYKDDGTLENVPASQQGAGVGASYQAVGGSFYLQVNAIGDWDISIVQVSGNSDTQTETSEPGSDIIASFIGSGGQNTRPFTADGPWEVQWSASGDIFQLYLYTANGELVSVPANQQGAGEGASYQPQAGSYYLQVNAIGDWEIEIVPVR